MDGSDMKLLSSYSLLCMDGRNGAVNTFPATYNLRLKRVVQLNEF